MELEGQAVERPYVGSTVGYCLPISNLQQQVYLQKYFLLNGPDYKLNRTLRKTTRECWTRVDVPERRIKVTCLPAPHYGVDQSIIADLKREPPDDPLAWRSSLAPYVWKVNALPASADKIISIGSGEGHEIAVMRCLRRGQTIEGVDFRVGLSEAVRKRYEFSFTHGDWYEYLRERPRAYDAAFSNHCMEHTFVDPTEMLRTVADALKPSGVYVFAMPIEMSRSNPFARFFPLMLRRPFYPWMLDVIDCAHAWKTDLPELDWRLREAGFARVEFFFRGDGASYEPVTEDALFNSNYDKSWEPIFDAVNEGGTASDLRLLVRARERLGWLWYGARNRVGLNHFKNKSVHEVLVRATKAAAR